MKTLLRLCSAAALAAAVTACGEVPTAVKTEIAPARRDGGGFLGGGTRLADGDTLNVANVSRNTVAESGCLDERGGVIGGGGHFMGDTLCQ